MASTSVVLPWSTWATMATFLMSAREGMTNLSKASVDQSGRRSIEVTQRGEDAMLPALGIGSRHDAGPERPGRRRGAGMPYDEFGLFHEKPLSGACRSTPRRRAPGVRGRRARPLTQRTGVGHRRPQLVLLHGGAQNAPHVGHRCTGPGASPDRDRPAGPRLLRPARPTRRSLARAFAPDIDSRRACVGAERSGARRHVARWRDRDGDGRALPRELQPEVLVDATPAFDPVKAAPIGEFVRGPESFAVVRRDPRAHDAVQPHAIRVVTAARCAPQRRGASRRHLGVASPAALGAARRQRTSPTPVPDFESLWDDVEHSQLPILLVRGTAARHAGRRGRASPSSPAAAPRRAGDRGRRRPGTACRAISRSSSQASSRTSSTTDRPGPARSRFSRPT
jgi:hypothetical protein